MVSIIQELSLEDANALLPELHCIVREQLLWQSEMEEIVERLCQRCGVIPRELGPLPDDPREVITLKEELADSIERVDTGWRRVHQLGGVVKDPRSGLVDFVGRVHRERVWLCWRFGEELIAYYHGWNEGFAGRKALPGATRHLLFH